MLVNLLFAFMTVCFSLFVVLQVCLSRRGGHCDCQGQLRHELPLLRYVHPGHLGNEHLKDSNNF